MTLAAEIEAEAHGGGLKGCLTPDPVAHGIPTGGGPVLTDNSASITSVNICQRPIREGRSLPGNWLMDADGQPSNDPQVLGSGGMLLPSGGMDHGQMRNGMALHVEALTQGLAAALPQPLRGNARPGTARGRAELIRTGCQGNRTARRFRV